MFSMSLFWMMLSGLTWSLSLRILDHSPGLLFAKLTWKPKKGSARTSVFLKSFLACFKGEGKPTSGILARTSLATPSQLRKPLGRRLGNLNGQQEGHLTIA